MNPIRSLSNAIFKGKRPFPGSTGGGRNWLSMIRLPGSNKDWSEKAGTPWKNSAAAIGIDWVAQSFPEARAAVAREKADGTLEYDLAHPLSRLLRRPNAYYGARALWFATVTSLLGDGNAYWMLFWDPDHISVREMWYVPHWMMEPRWPDDGSEFISHYDYSPGSGGVQKIPVEDVVQLRYGMDPENTRKGLGPLKRVLREVAADNECTTYTATILENLGIPGLIVSETDKDAPELTEEEEARVKRKIKARTTGDERGKMIYIPAPIKVDMLGFSPEQLALDKIQSIPASRILASLHLNAMAVGLPDSQRTYSNFPEAERQAWSNAVLPLMAMVCDDLDIQLLPRVGGRDGEMCAFDTRRVRALQEDQDKLHDRARKNFAVGIWKRSEAREATGKIVDKAADEVYITDIQDARALAAAERTAQAQQALPAAGAQKAIGPAPASWAERVEAELLLLHKESA